MIDELKLTEIIRRAFASWEKQSRVSPTREDFDFYVKCTVKEIMQLTLSKDEQSK